MQGSALVVMVLLLASVPPSPEELLSQLRDHLAPEEPPDPGGSWVAWLWPILVFALGTLLLIWLWRRRRTQPERALAPVEWALQELGRLEAQKLPDAGEVDRFHVLLADTIRGYLERRYHLPASRQTTPEFLSAARPSLPLAQEEQTLLADLLQRCDLAKFARAAPAQDDCRTALNQARSFIAATAARPLPVENPAS